MVDYDNMYTATGGKDTTSESFKSGETIGNYSSGNIYQAGDQEHYVKKYGTDVRKWPYQNPGNRKMRTDQ